MNGWLTKLELKAIERQVENKSLGELSREQDITVEVEIVETDLGTVESNMNDEEVTIGDTEWDLNDVHWTIVKQLKKNNGGRKNRRWNYVQESGQKGLEGPSR